MNETVLVAVASKHGGTRGIGEAVADELRAMRIDAELLDFDEVPDPGRYDAVVLGSAVYMGRWLPEARRFAGLNLAALRAVPVWLFSSGPLGDPPIPPGDPTELDCLAAELGARAHRTFAGRLDPGDLGLGERLVAKAVRAPAGDFREWEAIRAWARSIGAALRPDVVPAAMTAHPGAPTAGEEGTP
jgi:menaquinone-dependent protoporphyrinogen oxidase